MRPAANADFGQVYDGGVMLVDVLRYRASAGTA